MDSASILRGTSFVSLWYSLVLRCLRLLQCFEIYVEIWNCQDIQIENIYEDKYHVFLMGVITRWGAPHTVGDTVNISGKHASTALNIWTFIIWLFVGVKFLSQIFTCVKSLTICVQSHIIWMSSPCSFTAKGLFSVTLGCMWKKIISSVIIIWTAIEK